jgi:hypothetical protein
VTPRFEMSEFAKDSESRLAAARRATIPEMGRAELESSMRLKTQPPIAAPNEAWAATMTGPPVVSLDARAIRQLPLDHRTGFVLSLIDGTVDLETLVVISAMPREEVLRIVRALEESGVVSFRDLPSP